MLKPVVIGFLWTFAAYSAWKLGAGLVGLPQALDLVAMVVSAVVGAVIGLGQRTFASQPIRRIAQIPDRAGPTEGVPAPNPRG